MKDEGCVCERVGTQSILKMLQISTAFPRNHKHAFCLPAGLPLLPEHWILLTAELVGNSVVGVGIGDPLEWGLPCCLGRLPGASFVRLGSGYECAPGLCSTLGTHHARQALPRSGVIMVPTPLLCHLGAPSSQPSSPMWCLAAASVLLNTGDSVSKAYFSVIGSSWVEASSLDLGHCSGSFTSCHMFLRIRACVSAPACSPATLHKLCGRKEYLGVHLAFCVVPSTVCSSHRLPRWYLIDLVRFSLNRDALRRGRKNSSEIEDHG